MNNSGNWIVVGRFGRVHGIKGFITVHSFTDPAENILQYAPLYTRSSQSWQKLNIANIEVTAKHILVQIEGYLEREQVASFTNAEIGIQSEQLPALNAGEHYWHDLIGMQVMSKSNEILGDVTDIISTGANDVLVVEGKKRELIPYLPGRSIIKVNEQEKQIIVDWDTDF